MDGPHIFIYVSLSCCCSVLFLSSLLVYHLCKKEGVVSLSHWTSGSELEMTVRPGDSISLYCDCKLSTGFVRNFSSESYDLLIVNITETDEGLYYCGTEQLKFVRNFSSESYDLLIVNITETDEGLYYCGTEQFKVEKNEQITSENVYTHENISTRIHVRVVSFSHDWTSGSELERTVRPGENITLYCDCKLSTGVYIVWYRNCSHENQPSLVLKNEWTQTTNIERVLNPLPRFHFVRNYSSESYDLLIVNITETDEGLYYCGTETFDKEAKELQTDQQTPQTRKNRMKMI
ncbi:Immunoglobulin superfamily member 2 [Dissostichus eleginoides]|nr:Immunoglobulin superfamily member 2 [Dissostichus eleginoides]